MIAFDSWICLHKLQWSRKRKWCSCSKFNGWKQGKMQNRPTRKVHNIEKQQKGLDAFNPTTVTKENVISLVTTSNENHLTENVQTTPFGAQNNFSFMSGITLHTVENSPLESIDTNNPSKDSMIQ